MSEERKSSRKVILNGQRVRFNNSEIGEYSEENEEKKIKHNKKKYNNGGTKQPI
jgi:hypothetical protein